MNDKSKDMIQDTKTKAAGLLLDNKIRRFARTWATKTRGARVIVTMTAKITNNEDGEEGYWVTAQIFVAKKDVRHARSKGETRVMTNTGKQGQHGEPWKSLDARHFEIEVYADDGKGDLIVTSRHDNGVQTRRRQRIQTKRIERAVACVNGCAGINPEAVKALLASCIELSTILKAAAYILVKNDLEQQWLAAVDHPGVQPGFAKRAKATIAKAKGKEPNHE